MYRKDQEIRQVVQGHRATPMAFVSQCAPSLSRVGLSTEIRTTQLSHQVALWHLGNLSNIYLPTKPRFNFFSVRRAHVNEGNT